MKELIIKALDEAFGKLESLAPKVKSVSHQVNITGCTLSVIQLIAKENNIPTNATIDYIDCKDNYNEQNEIGILWYTNEPTTNDDKIESMRKDAWDCAFKAVCETLNENGYKHKRVTFNPKELAEIGYTTIYDMYINKSWDDLVKFYSFTFKK